MATTAGDRNRIDQLPRQMVQEPQATWPAVTASNGGSNMNSPATAQRGHGKNIVGVMVETALNGPTPNGSFATTEKRGAPNPVFAFWLMGFPDEWISGALAAMQSYRKPRRK